MLHCGQVLVGVRSHYSYHLFRIVQSLITIGLDSILQEKQMSTRLSVFKRSIRGMLKPQMAVKLVELADYIMKQDNRIKSLCKEKHELEKQIAQLKYNTEVVVNETFEDILFEHVELCSARDSLKMYGRKPNHSTFKLILDYLKPIKYVSLDSGQRVGMYQKDKLDTLVESLIQKGKI